MSNEVLAGLLAICMLLPFMVSYVASVVNKHRVLDLLWVKLIFPVAWLLAVGVSVAVAVEGNHRFNHSGNFWFYWALFGFLSFGSLIALLQELEPENSDDE